MNATRPRWWLVTGSGDGLVRSGHKPLLQPIDVLTDPQQGTYDYDTYYDHALYMDLTWNLFHK